METSEKKNSRIIKLCQTDLHQFMMGKMSIAFPEDTEMIAVRDCFHQGTVDFVLRSKEFDEVKQGEVIPCFSPMIQKVVPVGYGHAHSLRSLVEFFKGLVEAGNLPDTPLRSDQLTTEYCDELIEALNVQ
jgi:hypothetical protein